MCKEQSDVLGLLITVIMTPEGVDVKQSGRAGAFRFGAGFCGSTLSSTERSEVRIEGCGFSDDTRLTRTPRYGLAPLNLLGMLLT
jgi:hypothetical protein